VSKGAVAEHVKGIMVVWPRKRCPEDQPVTMAKGKTMTGCIAPAYVDQDLRAWILLGWHQAWVVG